MCLGSGRGSDLFGRFDGDLVAERLELALEAAWQRLPSLLPGMELD